MILRPQCVSDLLGTQRPGLTEVGWGLGPWTPPQPQVILIHTKAWESLLEELRASTSMTAETLRKAHALPHGSLEGLCEDA